MSATRRDLADAAVWTLHRHRDEIVRLRRGFEALAEDDDCQFEGTAYRDFAQQILDGHDPADDKRRTPGDV